MVFVLASKIEGFMSKFRENTPIGDIGEEKSVSVICAALRNGLFYLIEYFCWKTETYVVKKPFRNELDSKLLLFKGHDILINLRGKQFWESTAMIWELLMNTVKFMWIFRQMYMSHEERGSTIFSLLKYDINYNVTYGVRDVDDLLYNFIECNHQKEQKSHWL